MATTRLQFFRPAREGVELREHWLEVLARVGFLAKGIVYGLIGVLAVRMALSAAQSPSTQNALRTVLEAPFGRILLAVVAIGLAAYAVWRVAQGWYNTENTNLAVRIGFAIAGLLNLAIAATAATIAWPGGSSGGGQAGQRQAAQTLLSFPGGWILLMVIGAIVIGVGIAHFRNAYKAIFMQKFEYAEMSQGERDWIKPVGRAGLSARGVVFCLIGLFVVVAGWQQAAGKIKGLGEAFGTLASQPFGQILLIVMALGFIAYAVFCVACARYRHIPRV